jgi:hypothetical protein
VKICSPLDVVEISRVMKNKMIVKTYNGNDGLASKMHNYNNKLAQSMDSCVRSILTHKNRFTNYCVKKKIGKSRDDFST